MLLAFTDYYGAIFPFAALREVYYQKGKAYIQISRIGITRRDIYIVQFCRRRS